MARINLLPWREALRRQRQRDFIGMLGLSAAVALGVWFGIRLVIADLTEYQERRNTYLQQQISAMDAQIREIRDLEKKRERLLARMRTIERLQASRPVVVRLFDEIVRTLPDGVFLNELTQRDRRITVRGTARSNARVSNLMRNIEASGWVTNPRLQIIETRSVEGERVAEFTLIYDQKPPEGEATASGEDALSGLTADADGERAG